MTRILGISGSLRKGSYNTALLKAATSLVDRGVSIDVATLHGIPGVFKNAIDWLSRPASDIAAVFGNRAVAVIGASPWRFGTVSAQTAWLPVLRTLRTRPWYGGRLLVSHVDKLVGVDGDIEDQNLRDQLREFLSGFVRFLQTNTLPVR